MDRMTVLGDTLYFTCCCDVGLVRALYINEGGAQKGGPARRARRADTTTFDAFLRVFTCPGLGSVGSVYLWLKTE